MLKLVLTRIARIHGRMAPLSACLDFIYPEYCNADCSVRSRSTFWILVECSGGNVTPRVF